MGITVSTFTTATAVSAADIITEVERIEEFINGGIVAGDLQTSSTWVDSTHIFKPDLSTKRSVCVSGDIHHRSAGFDLWERSLHYPDASADTWVPIRGTSATFHVPAMNTVYCDILASLYVWEVGGDLSTATERENTRCAQLALFINGSRWAGSIRKLFASTDGDYYFARKQHCWVGHTAALLVEGINTVEVRIRVDALSTYTGRDWKHIFVEGRNMVIDTQEL